MIQAHADGELPADLARDVEAHLRSCPGCTLQMEWLPGVVAELEALPDVPIGRDLTGPVLDRIRRRPRPGRAWAWLGALELALGSAIVYWAWPTALRSALAVLPAIQQAVWLRLDPVLSESARLLDSLRSVFSHAVYLDPAHLLPTLGLAQAGLLLGAGAMLWTATNLILLRGRAGRGPG